MVVMAWPARSPIATPQERVASPSTCTVQAPQSATPQPNLVPVSPSSSRRNHNSGIAGSPSYCRSSPLTRRLIIGSLHHLVVVVACRSQAESAFILSKAPERIEILANRVIDPQGSA